mmetsp:Transcript_28997/g.85814  ORF Transcript_28997/g.85814 Transcript_28997/m.85814 type:complete len:303 (-) Transcript_28997:406-1314(-)
MDKVIALHGSQPPSDLTQHHCQLLDVVLHLRSLEFTDVCRDLFGRACGLPILGATSSSRRRCAAGLIAKSLDHRLQAAHVLFNADDTRARALKLAAHACQFLADPGHVLALGCPDLVNLVEQELLSVKQLLEVNHLRFLNARYYRCRRLGGVSRLRCLLLQRCNRLLQSLDLGIVGWRAADRPAGGRRGVGDGLSQLRNFVLHLGNVLLESLKLSGAYRSRAIALRVLAIATIQHSHLLLQARDGLLQCLDWAVVGKHTPARSCNCGRGGSSYCSVWLCLLLHQALQLCDRVLERLKVGGLD